MTWIEHPENAFRTPTWLSKTFRSEISKHTTLLAKKIQIRTQFIQDMHKYLLNKYENIVFEF